MLNSTSIELFLIADLGSDVSFDNPETTSEYVIFKMEKVLAALETQSLLTPHPLRKNIMRQSYRHPSHNACGSHVRERCLIRYFLVKSQSSYNRGLNMLDKTIVGVIYLLLKLQ